ncbi:thioesterase family protein [Saccharopolyspora sp. NFXS83]|uniref:acyl-CoA thioesterase n=1 Tax=Saccharopolyspora sp. NFXS83 TaxID=2993560 RepID=UPI00224B2D69|nr:thioesterase family protein [Saccharopolyspora sp. NFXS83]MCX2732727.1 thioesterase family protein [Saccharopolyspora sp. NFXS83]
MAEPAETPPGRADFTVLWPITTRWSDNDVYGHINNVVHYSWFDTAVNGWLMRATGADIREFPEIGLVVETNCRYLAELGFPDDVEVGVGLERLGNSSVVYRLAVFGNGAAEPASVGRFVHVYVDRETRRPVRVPERIRKVLADLEVVGG